MRRTVALGLSLGLLVLFCISCAGSSSSSAADSGSGPAADFAASVTVGDPPLSVTFTNRSKGEITSCSWDFGDGGTSGETNPSHTYITDGAFTVTLTVSGPDGSDTLTRVSYIECGDIPGPAVDFEASEFSGLAPFQVQFTEMCIGDNVHTWLWQFGDGTSLYEQNPSHTYSIAGTYDVTLTATDNNGTRSLTKHSYITVTGGGSGTGSGGSGGQTGLHSVSVSGRTTTIYCPTNYSSGKTWPVIVNLPGLGDTGSNCIRKWLPGVSPYPAEGYILVGCQLQTWPMEPDNVPLTADYQYVLACIDYVRAKYNVDLGRTLLVGFSRGATMGFYFVADAARVNAICTMDGKFCSNIPLDSTPKIPFYVMGSGMYVGQVSTAQAYLTQYGYDVTAKTFPELGHGWVIDENPAILTWFTGKTR